MGVFRRIGKELTACSRQVSVGLGSVEVHWKSSGLPVSHKALAAPPLGRDGSWRAVAPADLTNVPNWKLGSSCSFWPIDKSMRRRV